MSVISGTLIILVVMFFKGGLIQLFINLLAGFKAWLRQKEGYKFGKDE
jgi:hypothetical protein